MEVVKLLRTIEKELSQKEIGERIGVDQSTISRWKSGKQEPKIRQYDALLKLKQSLQPSVPREEFVPGDVAEKGDIPNLVLHAGAGGGGLLDAAVNEKGEVVDPESSDGYWSFPDSIKSMWRNMQRTYAFPVVGDSMEPTLKSGSIVFVDTSHIVPSPEDIYALDYGDGLVIKRLKLIPKTDRIRVISDNDRYGSDELLRSDVRVYGRVVAWFQWRR